MEENTNVLQGTNISDFFNKKVIDLLSTGSLPDLTVLTVRRHRLCTLLKYVYLCPRTWSITSRCMSQVKCIIESNMTMCR